MLATLCASAFADDFSSFLIDYAGKGRKANFAVVCIDSFTISQTEKNCEISICKVGQRGFEKRFFVQQNKQWKEIQHLSNAKLSASEQDFIVFVNLFSSDKDFQIKHTVFPLPILQKETPNSGNGKKKLVMPRDWETKNITQHYPTLYSFQPHRTGNNRKIYLYQGGVCKEYYNFIFINQQWYLIEMETYF